LRPLAASERTACQLVGLSVRTIWDLIKRGSAPTLRMLIRPASADSARWKARRAAGAIDMEDPLHHPRRDQQKTRQPPYRSRVTRHVRPCCPNCVEFDWRGESEDLASNAGGARRSDQSQTSIPSQRRSSPRIPTVSRRQMAPGRLRLHPIHRRESTETVY
jgi:hypothetical protein